MVYEYNTVSELWYFLRRNIVVVTCCFTLQHVNIRFFFCFFFAYGTLVVPCRDCCPWQPVFFTVLMQKIACQGKTVNQVHSIIIIAIIPKYMHTYISQKPNSTSKIKNFCQLAYFQQTKEIRSFCERYQKPVWERMM